MLFGVAGGLARYLNVDSSIVRIVWALLVLAGGAGILLYIVAAIVIPEEPEGFTSGAGGAPGPGLAGSVDGSPNTRTDLGNAPIIFGIVLVLIGGWLLLERFIDIDSRFVWPIVVLVLGLVLVLGSLRGRGRT
jgi:phage shock protein PspC (stress-responsive transcriptional regulator)